MYDIFGKFETHFSMGQEARDHKIIDSRFFYTSQGTGVAVLTSKYQIFLVNNVKEPKVRALSQLNISATLSGPISWEILCEKRETQVLLACGSVSDVFRFTEANTSAICTANPTSEGNILSIAVSINNTTNPLSVALFTDAGYLWIGQSDLRAKYVEIQLDKRTPPKQMIW